MVVLPFSISHKAQGVGSLVVSSDHLRSVHLFFRMVFFHMMKFLLRINRLLGPLGPLERRLPNPTGLVRNGRWSDMVGPK